MKYLAITLQLAAALALTSCDTRTIPEVDASSIDSGATDSGSGVDSGPPGDAGERLDDVLIYAHSRDTLFTFSPFSNTVTEVGVFQIAGGGGAAPFMLDLAVDAEGNVFTCSDQELWSVDPVTAEVTSVGSFGLGGEQLFALSFLTPTESPDGTEMLIGATNMGAYYEVQRDTAATSLLGNYPDGWFSSGDIVSVADLGTFATLRRDGAGPDEPDVLARIIFNRDGSSSVAVIGPTRSATEDFNQIFGLGYWGRNVYGFTNAAQLIRIDRTTGASEIVSTSTGADRFWGAGVTTQAPVLI